MPYSPPFLLRNKHLNTIYPYLLRKVKGIRYHRERVATWDEDFIDLDFSKTPDDSNTLIVLTHGLEGSSDAIYMKGMARAMNQMGWDTVALNLRSCSGELNQLLSSYHSGKSDDLGWIVQYLIQHHAYRQIALVGFSLGGNLTLKYTGEQGAQMPSVVKAVAAISVPCDLEASAHHLTKWSNRIYLTRLLNDLKQKAIQKKRLFPEANYSIQQVKATRNFKDFDDLFTAPVHGFKDAKDYWTRCSSRNFLSSIATPTLLINAVDDPFLAPACYPHEAPQSNPNFFFDAPQHGGHVGFTQDLGLRRNLYHEDRVVEFFKKRGFKLQT